MAQNEYNLHAQICDYLRSVHPHVMFRSDLGGVRLHQGLRVKVKRLQKDRAFPDLTVLRPVGAFSGLFIELKFQFSDVFTKSGGLSASNAVHVLEQAAVLMYLRSLGYAADLTIGYDQTTTLLDAYLGGDFQYTGNVREILLRAKPEQIDEAVMNNRFAEWWFRDVLRN